MKEYTILAVISVFITIWLDSILKTGLLRNRLFYLFVLVIAGFKFLVNGFLTGESMVIYNPQYFLGIRLGSIPLEDFLFGFSMVMLSVIFWEYFKRSRA
ncbi:MAG: lycopene cyclase domain-containing protein [Candidatus Omnitrophota bacterium]|jgi:lycopene cyclase domain-containing protein